MRVLLVTYSVAQFFNASARTMIHAKRESYFNFVFCIENNLFLNDFVCDLNNPGK